MLKYIKPLNESRDLKIKIKLTPDRLHDEKLYH